MSRSTPSIAEIVLSPEQEDIVQLVAHGHNVMANSKAGAGKSTVALAAGYRFFEHHRKRTLLLTYNARLKTETRERIASVNLEYAVDAHNYHALACRYFPVDTSTGFTDALIHSALSMEPRSPLDYGLVVIDELQDANPLYYKFIVHVVQHLECKPVMLLLGDPFQRIFGFNGSTDAYLMEPATYFGPICATPTFTLRHLSICWRITHEMAAYVNTSLNPCNLAKSHPDWWRVHGDRITAWWNTGIHANPARPPAPDSVKLIRGWSTSESVKAANAMFKQYGNDNVALLTLSLKGQKNPIKCIVDKLGKGEMENWVVMDGTEYASDEVMKGKRVAGTVHRFKGLERDGVLYCGMNSYTEQRSPDPLGAFNINYVACTRARQQLIVNVIGEDFATVRGAPLLMQNAPKQMCLLRQLVEYVPFDETLSLSSALFEARVIIAVPERSFPVSKQACLVPGRVSGTVENLTSVLSRAVSLQLMLLVQHTLCPLPVDISIEFDEDMMEFQAEVQELPLEQLTWGLIVKYAVAFETVTGKYLHRWRQLRTYEPDEKVVGTLAACVDNTLNLLWGLAVQRQLVQGPLTNPRLLQPLLSFDTPVSLPLRLPWYTNVYEGMIRGTAEVVFHGDTVVGIQCTDGVEVEQGIELALQSSILQLQRNQPVQTCMIMANACQLVAIELKLPLTAQDVPRPFEFIYRLVRRKLGLSMVDDQTLSRDFATASRMGWF